MAEYKYYDMAPIVKRVFEVVKSFTIAPGADVENCVIMNDSVVGEGAELKYVILDKDVTVTPGAKLIGTKKSPVIVKRGETV